MPDYLSYMNLSPRGGSMWTVLHREWGDGFFRSRPRFDRFFRCDLSLCLDVVEWWTGNYNLGVRNEGVKITVSHSRRTGFHRLVLLKRPAVALICGRKRWEDALLRNGWPVLNQFAAGRKTLWVKAEMVNE